MFIKKMGKLAVAIMCKNEAENIIPTLESISGKCDYLYVYDTGSTDDTIKVIKKFVDKTAGLTLKLFKGKFTNFAESRNKLLDYIKTSSSLEYYPIDYVLLMDCGDILNGDWPSDLTEDGYMMLQRIKNSDGSTTEMYNIKVIKPNVDWKYVRPVHEVLVNPHNSTGIKLEDTFFLYQDRTNNTQSHKRFYQDRDILLELYNYNKNNPNRVDNDFFRDLYYLAQTFLCLTEVDKDVTGNFKKALKYYSLRASFVNADFKEETYNAMFYEASISDFLKVDFQTVFQLYWRCFVFMPLRVEPLIALGQHYYTEKNFIVAFMFANFACRHEIPDHVMTMNLLSWDYTRWRLMALVCFELGRYNENMFKAGREALEVAIEGGMKHNKNEPLDIELRDLFKKIDEERGVKKPENMELVDL